MAPLPSTDARTLRAVGGRRRAAGEPTVPALIRILRELAAESPALVAVFDAAAIAGERHLLSAWAHLGRSRAQGAPRLRDRAAELALYVAGDDQLPRALEKVGFSDATETAVVVAEKPLDPGELLPRLGLEPDPTAFPRSPDAQTLDRLGISATERSVVPPSAWEGLVLERVALLELSAPAHRAPTKTK